MSHIGNKIRMGYFRTPDKQGEYIKQLLEFTGDCSILDPTAGEGLILQHLSKNQEHDIVTYGVELDNKRAEIAKTKIDHLVHAPLESMVITNEVFSMIYLNPPYDFEMRGEDGENAMRKEYKFLIQSTRYLAKHGVLVYVIPSYRFADNKIARFLATQFDNVGIVRFSSEDYDDFKQCVFIGRKRSEAVKEINKKLYDFLLEMESNDFVLSNVTPIDIMVQSGHRWKIPSGRTMVKTFYTRLENKKEYVEDILNSKGFLAFKENAKPRTLEIGGNPIINIPQGQMALLLASGAINGIIGQGDKLHAVQGMEIVSKKTEEEVKNNDNGTKTTITKVRTQRDVSVKVITPQGIIKKFV